MSWYTESPSEVQLVKDNGGSINETTQSHDEMPPSLYIEAHKTPLVLDLIGGSSAYSHFDMKSLTNEIDSYILEEISRENLKDTKEDYQNILDIALKKLDLPEGTDVYAMIEKLVRYFRIQNKLYTALKDKQALMQADPLTLSAEKLGLYLNHHHGVRRN